MKKLMYFMSLDDKEGNGKTMKNSLNHDRWLTGISLLVCGIFIGVAITASFDWMPAGNADRRFEALTDDAKYFQDPELIQDTTPAAVDSALMPSVFALNRAFINAARNVTPAVVSVRNDIEVAYSRKDGKWYHFWEEDEQKSDEGGDDERRMYPMGLGSGVIISPDGYVLTNYHVVEKNSELTIIFSDMTEISALVVGSDLDTDIALLKIDSTNLPYASIGNSNDVEVGEWVLAVGTPFRQNLSSTVTSGIVSAKGRDINILRRRSSSSVEYFIQTDAVINPGNSGGPLVNLYGQVIGINTAIISNSGKYQGYGFAVPINLAMHVAEDIKKYGRVLRGFLGVHIEDAGFNKLQEMNAPVRGGVEIKNFIAGGSAEKAGLKRGDIIVSVDDREIRRSNELQNIILERRPGDQVKVEVLRDGESKIFWVTLMEMDVQPNQ